MDVYKSSAFEDRVNYAASCIVQGKTQGRHFDTCFEMSDGDYVTAALVRRVLKRPDTQLAASLFKALNKETAMNRYEQTRHLNRAQLRREAQRASLESCQRSGYTNL